MSDFEEKMHPKVMEFLTSDLGFPTSAIQQEIKASNLSFENEKIYRSDYAVNIYGEARIYLEVTSGNNFPDFFLNKKITSNLKGKTIYFIFFFENNSKYFYKITNTIEEIKSPPTFSDLLDEVPSIHNNVLNFLLEKREENKDLRFTLRSRNNNGRLDKGYWFLGNSDYVAFSFWTGKDYKNKTSNIYFEVTTKGDVILRISVKDSEKKKEALKDLTGMLDLRTNKSENVYWKYYDRNGSKNYIDVLDKFLSTDKKIIDLFIKNINHADLGFIPENKFESNLVFLKPYIEKRNESNIKEKTDKNPKEINYPPAIVLAKLDLINIGQFKKVSLDLSKKTTCILGSNGIGKTTLLRSLLVSLIGF
ncbi:MAG: AAA family ATPase, partial [Saprospiraceae bacterium]